MGEIVDAIQSFAIKGLDPLGQPREIPSTIDGDLYVAGRIFRTPRTDIPGIGTGAAYASGDAFGTKFMWQVPQSGIIQSLTFVDKDNEKLAKDLFIFIADFTATADNAAFAPSDDDLRNCIGFISLSGGDFAAANANAIARRDNIGLAYVAPAGWLYCQWVTRGADNIAAGKIPTTHMVII